MTYAVLCSCHPSGTSHKCIQSDDKPNEYSSFGLDRLRWYAIRIMMGKTLLANVSCKEISSLVLPVPLLGPLCKLDDSTNPESNLTKKHTYLGLIEAFKYFKINKKAIDRLE